MTGMYVGRNEVMALSSIQSTRVVQFHGVCVAPPNVAIVMQLAENGSLNAFLYGDRKSESATDNSDIAASVALPTHGCADDPGKQLSTMSATEDARSGSNG
eukprot:SAG31_NODE_28750_length_405_cov_1.333333_1_plen_100_part_10